jgi:hypothetical protein
MNRTNRGPFPRMRKDQLIIDQLPDEVLVYDLDRHKAHCLNGTAATVWRRCDGKTPPREIARGVERDLDQPFNEELVWLALRQLDKIHLLEDPIGLPPQLAGLSRREMVRALGIAAAVGVPLITSIVSPTPVQAVTCVPKNGNCTTTSQCCPGLVCNTGPNKCQ